MQLGGVPSLTTRPRSMMMARSHTASTSSRMCVETMIALVSPIARISSRTRCFWLGSRPSVGSSRISTSGSCRIAWARPTRRETFRQRIEAPVQHFAELDPVDRQRHRLPALAARHAAHVADEVKEAFRRHVGIERRAFGHIANAALGGDRDCSDVLAADQRSARRGRDEAGDDAHRRGLARAVGPRKPRTSPRSTEKLRSSTATPRRSASARIERL